jgi:hypothetical protein
LVSVTLIVYGPAVAPEETAKDPVTVPVEDMEQAGAGLEAIIVEGGFVASWQVREAPVANPAPKTLTVPSNVPKPTVALWPAPPVGEMRIVGPDTFWNPVVPNLVLGLEVTVIV